MIIKQNNIFGAALFSERNVIGKIYSCPWATAVPFHQFKRVLFCPVQRPYIKMRPRFVCASKTGKSFASMVFYRNYFHLFFSSLLLHFLSTLPRCATTSKRHLHRGISVDSQCVGHRAALSVFAISFLTTILVFCSCRVTLSGSGT